MYHVAPSYTPNQIDSMKAFTITIDPVENANGSYSHTTSDDRVSEKYKAVAIEVGTPETFQAPVFITTGNGTITLECANAVGSSTVTVTLEATTPIDGSQSLPSVMTSSEFDILANRIGTLSSLITPVKTDIVSAINEVMTLRPVTPKNLMSGLTIFNNSSYAIGNLVVMNVRLAMTGDIPASNYMIYFPPVKNEMSITAASSIGSVSNNKGVDVRLLAGGGVWNNAAIYSSGNTVLLLSCTYFTSSLEGFV